MIAPSAYVWASSLEEAKALQEKLRVEYEKAGGDHKLMVLPEGAHVEFDYAPDERAIQRALTEDLLFLGARATRDGVGAKWTPMHRVARELGVTEVQLEAHLKMEGIPYDGVHRQIETRLACLVLPVESDLRRDLIRFLDTKHRAMVDATDKLMEQQAKALLDLMDRKPLAPPRDPGVRSTR